MAKSQGSYVWYDLATSDVNAAGKFYSDVVGWTVKDSGMPGMDYRLFNMGEAGVAGLMTLNADAKAMGVPPMWLGHIRVDNVDDMAAKAKSLGGSIQNAPQDIPGVGRFAIIADPHGAVFSIFSASSEPQVELTINTPGNIGWHELYAGDGAAAFAFYSALFGWTKDQAMDMGEMGVYQLFAQDGVAIGGMMTKPPQIPMPSWLYYFNVDSASAAVERIENAGGKVLNGPMEVPGPMWTVQAMDPQGAAFAVVATAR
jgi:hypothetical protein